MACARPAWLSTRCLLQTPCPTRLPSCAATLRMASTTPLRTGSRICCRVRLVHGARAALPQRGAVPDCSCAAQGPLCWAPPSSWMPRARFWWSRTAPRGLLSAVTWSWTCTLCAPWVRSPRSWMQCSSPLCARAAWSSRHCPPGLTLTLCAHVPTRPCHQFSHRFMGIAEQMGRTLQRTSISVNIKVRPRGFGSHCCVRWRVHCCVRWRVR